jgi:hypothetical protein
MTIKRILGIPLLLLPALALAGPGWQVTTLQVEGNKAGQVVEALDELLSSKVAKDNNKGRVTLQAHVADGTDPSTHSIIVYYRSMAEREPGAAKIGASKEWSEFLDTMADSAIQIGTYRGVQIKSWGDVNDSDTVWINYFFRVSNPAAMVSIMDHYNASETGRRMPGQVHLGGVLMGGMNSPTHVVSVGFASEAEMESWRDELQGNADWMVQLEALSAVGEYMGAELMRDVRSWGPASLEDVTAQ